MKYETQILKKRLTVDGRSEFDIFFPESPPNKVCTISTKKAKLSYKLSSLTIITNTRPDAP